MRVSAATRVSSSCPAKAGKGDRVAQQRGGRGLGLTAGLSAARPLHHPAGGPPPPRYARWRITKSFSRRSHAPELCQPPPKRFASGTHDPEKWCPVFGQDHAQTRGRRSAERRIQPISAQHRQTSPLAGARARRRANPGRARLPALRRGSRRDFHIPAQLQAMLPGTRFRRALPALSCPSPVEAPHTSAVVPKRMMPKAAPARTANPRGSTALAPLPKVPSRRRPSMSEYFWL